MTSLKKLGLPFVGFLLLAFLVFGASLQFGFSVIDDYLLVVQNVYVHGLTIPNIVHAFTSFDPELYIPFTLLSFQLNYVLGGLNAGIYHFTNIVLHAGSATLVFWILKKCTDKTWVQIIGALLFLLHPINTEAVVWVAGRKDVLSTFFALLSVGFFITSSRQEWRSDEKNIEMRARFFARIFHPYFLSILFFLFALLSKVSVLTLPLALILLEVFRRSDETLLASSRKALRSVAPFLLLSILFGIIALFGKERVVGDSSFIETLLMATKSTMFYVQKLFVPTGLNPVYPYSDAITITSIDFWLPLGLFLVLTGLLFRYYKRHRWPLFVWLAYIILLSPTFLNYQKGGIAYFAVDRYAYLSLIPIFILIALGIGELHEKLWRHRPIVMGASAALVLTLGILTVMQVQTWRSDEVLLKRSIKLYPDNVLARTAIASLYRQAGDLESETLVLKEGEAYSQNIAYTLGLGSIEERKGNYDAAQTYYEEARLMDPKNPEPLFYMGALSELEGGTDHAKILYMQAIDLDESYVSPMINLGAIFSDEGNLAEAEHWFRRALEWTGGSFELRYNLGKVLEEQGKKDEAFPHFEAAYRLYPEDPDIVTAYAYRLHERGEHRKALRIVEEYLRIDPENRTALRLKSLIEDAL